MRLLTMLWPPTGWALVLHLFWLDSSLTFWKPKSVNKCSYQCSKGPRQHKTCIAPLCMLFGDIPKAWLDLVCFFQPTFTKLGQQVSQTWPGSDKACDESPPLLFLLSTLHQAECCGNSGDLWLLFDHTLGVWPVTKWWQTQPTHRAASIDKSIRVYVFPTHSAAYLTRGGRSQHVRVLRIHNGHLAFNS